MPSETTSKNDPAGFRLLLTPDRAALTAGGPTTVRVLVRMQAPDAPPGTARRAPLHLALVLDRSGSMGGAPLEEAKRCARNIIDSLAPGDRAAIFAFDNQVQRVAPLTSAADKLALSAALAGIHAGGTTNLHGGWRAGADELLTNLAGRDVHRVIVLSDGCANAGETGLDHVVRQHRHREAGGASELYGVPVRGDDAEVLREQRRQHEMRERCRVSGQQAVDLSALQMSIQQCRRGGVAHEIERASARMLAERCEPNACDPAQVEILEVVTVGCGTDRVYLLRKSPSVPMVTERRVPFRDHAVEHGAGCAGPLRQPLLR